jgi:hypothetical protein
MFNFKNSSKYIGVYSDASLDRYNQVLKNMKSTAGDTLHILLLNNSSLRRKFAIKDGNKKLFGNVQINPNENRLFDITNAGFGTNIIVSNDLGQSIRLPIMQVGSSTNYDVKYEDTGFSYLWY